MRRVTAIALLPIAALALAACGGSADAPAESGPAATLTTAGATSPGAATDGTTEQPTDDGSASSDDGLFGTPADVGGPYGELRDGLWGVGPAGEVEFRVTSRDTLELVSAGPADGWDLREQEVESDKIRVDLRRGPVDFELEVEIDAGVLEIEIDQDIDPAGPGTFAVGEAGTVEVSVADGRLVLGELDLAGGWNEVQRNADDDDIELRFRRDGDGFFELWEFRADLDGGALDVEVDYEIEGTFGQ